MVRAAGAAEVHMRISSPPISDSCYYGIDTPTKDELLASKYTIEEMAELIGVDTLAFISPDGLYRAVCNQVRSEDEPQFCDACFTSEYPIPLSDHDGGLNPAQLSLLSQVD
jgi:amidophosphoribosyltransferase